MIFRRRRPAPAAPVGAAPAASADVLARVRRLELRLRRLVNSRYAGEYRSVFKGQGMAFAEVREYVPGDEVRSIDWNVTARLRKLHIRRYEEERELTVLLLVDRSASMHFGSRGQLKEDVASEVASLLTLSALRNNDRVGVLLFTAGVDHAVPPRKGRRHGLRVLRDLLHVPGRSATSALAPVVAQAMQHLPHRGLVFVVSECRSPDAAQALRQLASRHEVVVLTVRDPLDAELPDAGRVLMRDPASGTLLEVDTHDAAFRARYVAAAEAARVERERLFRSTGVGHVALKTDGSVFEPLLAWFARRSARAVA
jgi:uncharacterized protein (DUF58 family)